MSRALAAQEAHATDLIQVQLLAASRRLIAASSAAAREGEIGDVPTLLAEVVEIGRRGLAALELLRADAALLGGLLTIESDQRLDDFAQLVHSTIEMCTTAAELADQAVAERRAGSR